MFNVKEGTAVEVIRETDAGIVVRGARILATLGPLADEIAVYSPRLARHSDDHSPFAVNFSIPCSTKGLKFLCRDSFDLGPRISTIHSVRGSRKWTASCSSMTYWCRGSGYSCFTMSSGSTRRRT